MAPTLVEYFPGGHFVHDSAVWPPAIIEYLPAEQSKQSDSSSRPGAFPYFPAGQGWHDPSDEAPVAAENVPMGQFVHVVSPVASANFPGPHAKHMLSAVAPLAVENLPTEQSVQVPLPPSALYVPAAHGSARQSALAHSQYASGPTCHQKRYDIPLKDRDTVESTCEVERENKGHEPTVHHYFARCRIGGQPRLPPFSARPGNMVVCTARCNPHLYNNSTSHWRYPYRRTCGNKAPLSHRRSP